MQWIVLGHQVPPEDAWVFGGSVSGVNWLPLMMPSSPLP
jgi:hypothetical protein